MGGQTSLSLRTLWWLTAGRNAEHTYLDRLSGWTGIMPPALLSPPLYPPPLQFHSVATTKEERKKWGVGLLLVSATSYCGSGVFGLGDHLTKKIECIMWSEKVLWSFYSNKKCVQTVLISSISDSACWLVHIVAIFKTIVSGGRRNGKKTPPFFGTATAAASAASVCRKKKKKNNRRRATEGAHACATCFRWGWKDFSRRRNSPLRIPLWGGGFCVYLFLSFAQ